MITQKEIEEHDKKCEEAKAACGDGPWKREPNRASFKHKGLDCLLVRNQRMLNWCGYVGVPEGHKFFGKNYDELEVSVHGDLTFSDICRPPVCHIADNEGGRVWWLGFDCAHGGDLVPFLDNFKKTNPDMVKLNKEMNERFGLDREVDLYRDMNYVTEEVKNLANQLVQA